MPIMATAWMLAESVDTAEIDRKVAAVIPVHQKWQRIPWETDLLRARNLASASGKPIFLWVMNGSPLGCT